MAPVSRRTSASAARADRRVGRSPSEHGRDSVEDDPLESVRPLPARGPGEALADYWHGLRTRLAVSSTGLVVGVLGLLAVGAGGWWLMRPPPPAVESTVPLAGTGGAGSTAMPGQSAPIGAGSGASGPSPGGPQGSTTIAAQLVVQASGAVASPGVYRLAADARVDDLVRAAGGLTPDADPDRVNLAAPVADGDRVWVPRRGETEVPPVIAGSGSSTSGGGPGPGKASPGVEATPEVVDLNTATADQLDTLPGVGPATAQAILSYRDEHGRFGSVDELEEVRGIGEAKLEQLRPLVRV